MSPDRDCLGCQRDPDGQWVGCTLDHREFMVIEREVVEGPDGPCVLLTCASLEDDRWEPFVSIMPLYAA